MEEVKRVFILGNGKSRKGITVEMLRPYGFVFGCNMIFETEEPDALVVHDRAMQDYVLRSDYEGTIIRMAKQKEIWPGYSGGAALYFACECFSPEEVWMFGFDGFYKALPNAKKNNIYAQHEHYLKTSGIFAEKTASKRMTFENRMVTTYKNVRIRRVIDKHSDNPKDYKVSSISKERFLQHHLPKMDIVESEKLPSNKYLQYLHR